MSCAQSELGRSISGGGSGFHPDLEYRKDSFGTSIYAASDLPPGTSAVSCPFAQAVTPALARTNLGPILPPSQPLSNHELITTYLALHRAYSSSPPPPGVTLAHSVYVTSLPTEADFATPCYYTPNEMELLRGTNLFGAVGDRLAGWKAEWEGVAARLAGGVQALVSWELWLWACTVISSRAFPSVLIDGDEANNTPVLFPGVDTLNHRYGEKVTWRTDAKAQTLTIVLENAVPAGSQAFNTYGPKPNEELLLGYGFTTPSNPADLVALKLQLPPASPLASTLSALFPLPPGHVNPSSRFRHFVPRSGALPPALLAQMRAMLLDPAEDGELVAEVAAAAAAGAGWEETALAGAIGCGLQVEFDMLGMLEEMLGGKFEGLIQGGAAARRVTEEVRAGVRDDCEEYRRGQIAILEAALADRERLFTEAVAAAKEAGVDMEFDEGDEGDDDEEELEADE